jgi:hypothetical protein
MEEGNVGGRGGPITYVKGRHGAGLKRLKRFDLAELLEEITLLNQLAFAHLLPKMTRTRPRYFMIFCTLIIHTHLHDKKR